MGSFVFIIFGIFASSIILCQCEDFMIMTRHPGVNDYFLEMVQHEKQHVQKSFKRWQNDVKLLVCKKMIDPVSFDMLNEDEDRKYGSVPYSVNNLLSRLQFIYDFGEIAAINYIVMAVNIKNVVRNVVTHPCIMDQNYQVAIASAFHIDVYFYLEKTEKMDSFRLTGVAEPKAFIHPLTNYNPKQLMQAYAINLFKQIEMRKNLRSFYTLSEYRKFRLCNLAYVSFMEQNNMKINRMNYTRVKNDRLNVKQANILIEVANEFYYVITDLISCTADSVRSTVQFHLIPDPHVKDSAFIVRKRNKTPQNIRMLGDFSGMNTQIDFEKAFTIIKSFTIELNKKKGSAQLKMPGIVTYSEKVLQDLQKRNVEGPVYDLEMVVMQLTPLLDFSD